MKNVNKSNISTRKMEGFYMRIIIDIETNNTENTSKIGERLNQSSEDTMFDIIKEAVEGIIERSHFTTDYFKGCKVTRE